MPFHIDILPDLPIVETTFAGTLPPDELSAAVEQSLALAKARGFTRFLADCRTLAGGHSAFDLYPLAQAVRASGLPHSVKEAILAPELPTPAQNVEFWKSACVILGFQVCLFQERAAALAWLLP